MNVFSALFALLFIFISQVFRANWAFHVHTLLLLYLVSWDKNLMEKCGAASYIQIGLARFFNMLLAEKSTNTRHLSSIDF
jgi:hypothetical protein